MKSGRMSPYFFDSGKLNNGSDLVITADAYVSAIRDAGVNFDMIFGTAYKGISLAVAVAMSFALRGQDYPYAFNRKESKEHGEGGNIIGAPLQGRVLLNDDVMTAGTALRESVEIVHAAGAEVAGLIIMLDRQEKGTGEKSAVQEAQESGVPVTAIITLDNLVSYLEGDPEKADHLEAMRQYREEYGAKF